VPTMCSKTESRLTCLEGARRKDAVPFLADISQGADLARDVTVARKARATWSIERAPERDPVRGVVRLFLHRRADRTTQFQPATRARRFFCFFLKAARLRAVFLLRFFSRMAVSYRLEELRQPPC
jgi:hypothetical protein